MLLCWKVHTWFLKVIYKKAITSQNFPYNNLYVIRIKLEIPKIKPRWFILEKVSFLTTDMLRVSLHKWYRSTNRMSNICNISKIKGLNIQYSHSFILYLHWKLQVKISFIRKTKICENFLCGPLQSTNGMNCIHTSKSFLLSVASVI